MKKIILIILAFFLFLLYHINTYRKYNSVTFCIAATSNIPFDADIVSSLPGAVDLIRKDCGKNLILIENGNTLHGTYADTVSVLEKTISQHPIPGILKDLNYNFTNISVEDFRYGKETLSEYLNDSGMNVITTNINGIGKEEIVTFKNIKISIQGIVSPFKAAYYPNEIISHSAVYNPVSPIHYNKFKHTDADYNVLAMQMNINKSFGEESISETDILMFFKQQFNHLDLAIFGGSTYSPEKKIGNSNAYINLGVRGDTIGYTKVKMIKKNDKQAVLVNQEVKKIPIKNQPKTKSIKTSFERYTRKMKMMKMKKIATIKREINSISFAFEETAVDRMNSEFLMDIAKIYKNPVDFALIMMKRAPIKKEYNSDILFHDFQNICQHHDFPIVIEMTGLQIRQFMEQSLGQSYKNSSYIIQRPTFFPLSYEINEKSMFNIEWNSLLDNKKYLIATTTELVTEMKYAVEGDMKVVKIIPELYCSLMAQYFPIRLWSNPQKTFKPNWKVIEIE